MKQSPPNSDSALDVDHSVIGHTGLPDRKMSVGETATYLGLASADNPACVRPRSITSLSSWLWSRIKVPCLYVVPAADFAPAAYLRRIASH